MTTIPILLIRHAESVNNKAAGHAHSHEEVRATTAGEARSDPELTPCGQRQAQSVGELVRPLLPSNRDQYHVMVSGLIRTQETARRAAIPHHQVLDDLNEIHPRKDDPQIAKAQVERFAAHLDEICRRPDIRMVVVFGHSVFFSVLLNHFITGGACDPTRVVIELPNASITSLAFHRDQEIYSVYQVGKCNHIDGSDITGLHTLFAN